MARSLTVHGTLFDLSHLEDLACSVELALSGGSKKQICVTFRFSNHCYTRGTTTGEEADPMRVVMDGSRIRVFSERRYELSKQLPDLMRDLPNRKVYKTPHHNLIHLTMVDEHGAKTDYLIALSLKRQGKSSEMLVVVESAYPLDTIEDKKKYDKPIRFIVALTRAFEGR